jgi:uncharacterized membrane protein
VTPQPRGHAWVALGVGLSVAFAILAHAAIVEGIPPAAGAALSLVPLVLIAILAARRSRRSRRRAAVLASIAAAALALWLGWGQLERHFSGLFFLEHAGSNLVLAIVFGRTLLAGREPLVGRFARAVHGDLPPEVVRYTRRVTVAWTIFFVLLFATSCALYLGRFLEAWSLLANIVTPLLVGAMFVIEYAVRLRALPDWERVGILGGVRAFSRHFAHAGRALKP